MKKHIILVGLTGAGKSTVGSRLAAEIGWSLLDVDSAVEQLVDRTISTLIDEVGIATFRAVESGVLARACLADAPTVIATGGGAVLDADNRRLMQEHGRVVYLTAPVDALAARFAQRGEDRPLMRGDIPATLQRMVETRDPLYRQMADYVQPTEAGVDATVTALRHWLHDNPAANISFYDDAEPLLQAAAELAGGAANLRIVTEAGVWAHHEQRVTAGLGDVPTFSLPPGDAAKSLPQLARLYDWLAATHTERGSVVVAVGGGAVGDLAGFAAATYLRGLHIVQVPTTLLAMVDAAIGGKTAINLAVGKNLVGAFHQPTLVLLDPGFLATLPRPEYTAGWGEVCKYAFIERSLGGLGGFLELLEQQAPALSSPANLTEQSTIYPAGGLAARRNLQSIISRCASLKAQIVAADEREQAGGGRILLNYGHTVAHGLEQASNYAVLHGNAVAIGMMAAATIAERLGVCAAALIERQRRLLAGYELFTDAHTYRLDTNRVLAALRLDKKVQAGRIRWVLPTTPGFVTLRDDVPPELVVKVVTQVVERHDD